MAISYLLWHFKLQIRGESNYYTCKLKENFGLLKEFYCRALLKNIQKVLRISHELKVDLQRKIYLLYPNIFDKERRVLIIQLSGSAFLWIS